MFLGRGMDGEGMLHTKGNTATDIGREKLFRHSDGGVFVQDKFRGQDGNC